jgi:hypothetical protein
VNRGKRKGRGLGYSALPLRQALSSYLNVAPLGTTLAVMLLLDRTAATALASLYGAGAFSKVCVFAANAPPATPTDIVSAHISAANNNVVRFLISLFTPFPFIQSSKTKAAHLYTEG